MVNATRSGRRKRRAADTLVHLAQAALVMAGVVAAGEIGSSYLKYEPVRFADIGVVNEVPEAFPVPHEAVAVVAHVEPLPRMLRESAQRVAPRADHRLSPDMQRVRDYVAGRYRVPRTLLEPVLAAAEHNARKAGIDPILIVAMMAIESSFNPRAVSSMGAQGLMQVIPRFHMDKIGEGRGENALFDPLLNVRVGTQVLVEGLERFGTLQAALQYYGGARSDPNATYANKVMAMKQRLLSAVERAERDAADV